jgi:uncharacterized protein (TIGR03000 family)
MYSVVLMAAMTQAVEVPDLFRRGGHGCSGGCYGGGCYGGGGWGGGCYGGGGWGGGCRGGCYGGGWGGCYGGGGGGCYGGGGGCYGGGRWAYGGGSWGGGYAYSPYSGGSYASYPSNYQMMPAAGSVEYRSGYYAPNTFGNGSGQLSGPTPATIVVRLPADARLMVDDEPTRSTSDERVFTSPPLQPGQTYYYVLKAEMDRNGEKVTATQNVTVRAGQTSRVTMEFPKTGSNPERDRDLNRNRTPEADRNRDPDRNRR